MSPRSPLRRAVAVLALCASVGVACSATPTGAPADDRASGPASDAPAPVGNAPEPDGPIDATTGAYELAEAPLAETVPVVRPDVLLRPAPEANASALYTAFGDEAVQQLAGAAEFNVLLVQEDAATPLLVFGIDPVAFRPLTPDVTANTVGVWERLADGDVVVRHDVAHRLNIELGGTIVLQGPTGSRLVRVGAFASTGTPPVADILVPWELSRALGADTVNLLVVAVKDGNDDEKTAKRLIENVGGGEYRILEPPTEQQASLSGGSARKKFQAFSYLDLGDGMIVIDPKWVRSWITTVTLPRVGRVRVHRLMAPQLLAAMEEVTQAGLLDHFKPEQFGGGYVPRHIDWNPAKPLSMHAWGLAVDFNTHDNWLGQTPKMDMRIVEIFERWGFSWGGRWSRPDGMHFELSAIVDPS